MSRKMEMTITLTLPDRYDDWEDSAVRQELEDLYLKNPHINAIMDQMKSITDKYPSMADVYKSHAATVGSGRIVKICEVNSGE